MKLSIAKLGDPILRQVAAEIPTSDILSGDVQSFIDDLIQTKREANGAGIAAPQVSKSWRVFVVEVQDNPRYPYKPNYPLTVVINPIVTLLTEERFMNFEGCLSIPDLRGELPRCPEIRVQGLDRNARPLDFQVRGITAGTFQHENDHLDGVLFVDHVVDSRTLCTWDEFQKHYEHEFRDRVATIVGRFGS